MPLTLNGTTGVAGIDGSASMPSIQGTDTNTGVWFPAADTVALATNGTERMRVDSSGNVGIGTSSPQSRLQVSGGSQILYVGAGLQTQLFICGNGTTAGSTSFDLIHNSTAEAYVWNRSNAPLIFGTNNSERARIDNAGVAMFGTSSQLIRSGEKFRVLMDDGCAAFKNINGSGFPTIHVQNASAIAAYVMAFSNSAGEVGTITTNSGSTSYNTSSDYRLKENVQPMQNALAKVALLNPVTYTWKADGTPGQGFIAHELQAVVPDCVTGEKDAVDADGNPRYQGVDTSFLVATLTKAIQELSAKVDALQTEINALKGAA